VAHASSRLSAYLKPYPAIGIKVQSIFVTAFRSLILSHRRETTAVVWNFRFDKPF